MKMKREVIAIEKHLYENKDHTVRTEYQVYYEPHIYNIKTPSQLTKKRSRKLIPDLAFYTFSTDFELIIKLQFTILPI